LIAAVHRKAGVLVFFAVMLAISNILLPCLGRTALGPFVDWRLFSGLNKSGYYDLEVRGVGQGFLSDDLRIFFSTAKETKIYLWSFTQKLALAGYDHPEERREYRDQIVSHLSGVNLELVRVCAIQLPLPEYMLLSSAEKRGRCDDVAP